MLKHRADAAAQKLELAACKTLGSGPRPHLSFHPLETRLQASLTPCQQSERSQPWPAVASPPGCTRNKLQQGYAVEAQINCIVVSTRSQQQFFEAPPAKSKQHRCERACTMRRACTTAAVACVAFVATAPTCSHALVAPRHSMMSRARAPIGRRRHRWAPALRRRGGGDDEEDDEEEDDDGEDDDEDEEEEEADEERGKEGGERRRRRRRSNSRSRGTSARAYIRKLPTIRPWRRYW